MDIPKNPDDIKQLGGIEHNYIKQIKTNRELGISSKPTLKALEKDIAGLINYTSLLTDGSGRAKKGRGPLGNRYFLKTLSKCTVKNKDGQKTQRYIYIDNVPSGKIKGLTNASGKSKNGAGLISGIIENVQSINPASFFTALTEGSEPECVRCPPSVCPVTRGNKKNQYIAKTEYMEIKRFAESFELMNNNKMATLNQFALSGLAVYLIYRLFKKMD